VADLKRAAGKPAILFKLASASLAQPDGAVRDVFLVGALIAVIALVVALFLRELPLRTTVGAAEEASAAAQAAR
jgi:hypothetical protein